jgi:hypothetical protein
MKCPTWTFTEEHFCLKLGIPANSAIIFVGINTFENKITVVGSTGHMSPEQALARIKTAVTQHDTSTDAHGVQWFVDDNIVDCSAPEFWGVVLSALQGMTVKGVNRGGKGGIFVDGKWYFQPTDGKGCPVCGAIGTGGHGGGCSSTASYDETGSTI